MMKSTSLLRNTFKIIQRFYRSVGEETAAPPVTQEKPKVVSEKEETPLHLRPYNKAKYEVPSTKLKYATGYALLDVEPMPRAKIMKLCYIIFDKLKEIPADAMYRIYTEEKLKYIMKQTDEIEDIRTLEEVFGYESIEMFIQFLHNEVKLVDHMKVVKPWEARFEDAEALHFMKQRREELKHQKLERPGRSKTEYLDTSRTAE